VLFAGNTVWSISERVRGVCVDALYKSTFTFLLLRYVSFANKEWWEHDAYLLQSCQNDLIKDSGHKYFLSVLSDQYMPVCTVLSIVMIQLLLYAALGIFAKYQSYLFELISLYAPTLTLRSVNTGLLVLPTGFTNHFASRSLYVSSPSVWNSLPAHVRSIDNLSTFKRHLKSYLFQSASAA